MFLVFFLSLLFIIDIELQFQVIEQMGCCESMPAYLEEAMMRQSSSLLPRNPQSMPNQQKLSSQARKQVNCKIKKINTMQQSMIKTHSLSRLNTKQTQNFHVTPKNSSQFTQQKNSYTSYEEMFEQKNQWKKNRQNQMMLKKVIRKTGEFNQQQLGSPTCKKSFKPEWISPSKNIKQSSRVRNIIANTRQIQIKQNPFMNSPPHNNLSSYKSLDKNTKFSNNSNNSKVGNKNLPTLYFYRKKSQNGFVWVQSTYPCDQNGKIYRKSQIQDFLNDEEFNEQSIEQSEVLEKTSVKMMSRQYISGKESLRQKNSKVPGKLSKATVVYGK